MWPLNIEPIQPSTANETFGKNLAQNWRPFGDLQLESILSAPISFNLPQ
jgi:hypothetical protein